jgi:hypothetical protein
MRIGRLYAAIARLPGLEPGRVGGRRRLPVRQVSRHDRFAPVSPPGTPGEQLCMTTRLVIP